MAIYGVQNNLSFETKVLPKNYFRDRDEILYNIGWGNFYEALKKIHENYYYRHCPAKGSLRELLKLESKRKEVLEDSSLSLSA